MSMLAGLMFFLVRFVMALVPALSLRYNSKKAAAVLAIFISAVYLVISGAAIPAQRAVGSVVRTSGDFDAHAGMGGVDCSGDFAAGSDQRQFSDVFCRGDGFGGFL